MRTRAAAVAVAVLAVVGATTGCAERPGVAAVVDGREITQDALNQTVDQLQPILGKADGSALDPQVVLTVLLVSPATVEVGEQFGIDVTDDAAREVLRTVAEKKGVDVGAIRSGSLAVGRYLVVMQESQGVADAAGFQKALDTAWNTIDVDLNPRYGAWQPGAGVVAGGVPDWIVGAADAEAPTAQ